MEKRLSAVEKINTQLHGSPQRLLFVLAGPSGVGKNTVIKEILAAYSDVMQRIRTYTTRPRRPDEIDGEQYFFVDNAEFLRLARAGGLMEVDGSGEGHQVYSDGIWYSMPSDLYEGLDEGKHIVLAEIDIHGARRVRELYPECVTIFLTAPPHDLIHRIKNRPDESMDKKNLQNRLNKAREHIGAAKEFTYLVFNEEQRLCDAVSQVKTIIEVERMRVTEGFRLEDTIPPGEFMVSE